MVEQRAIGDLLEIFGTTSNNFDRKEKDQRGFLKSKNGIRTQKLNERVTIMQNPRQMRRCTWRRQKFDHSWIFS